MPDQPMSITNCPTCNTKIYRYNQHVCPECGTQTCYYCETDHAATHKADKENTDAALPE